MKIAFIVPGGVDRSGRFKVIPHYLWLFEEFSRVHDVHVISLYQYPAPCKYKLHGSNIYDLGNLEEEWGNDNEPVFALRNTYAKALEILQTNGPWDVIHGFRGTQPGWLAATIGRYLHTPSVVSFLGQELNSGLSDHYRRLVTQSSSHSSCLTVASGFMADMAKSRGFNTHLIPFGVHDSCFQPNKTQDQPPWQLLSVADINRVKDHFTMLHALKRVVERISQVHLDIIGVDTLDGMILRLIEELRLTKHVTVHGSLPNDLVRPFFQRAHLYLVTSRHEGGPIAMLEAAACRVPTVGTKVGYVADWSKERSYAVEIGDADALAAGILKLLDNSALRMELGQAALQWARKYDIKWTAGAFLNLYGSLRVGDRMD